MSIVQIDPDDSIDQVFERIEQARVAANAKVEPWQTELRPGDHFVRLVLVAEKRAVAIYGEILKSYEEPRLEHYRFCRCYSVIMPDGERGDVHVSVMQKKLSPVQFKLAEEWGFPSDERVRKIVELQ